MFPRRILSIHTLLLAVVFPFFEIFKLPLEAVVLDDKYLFVCSFHTLLFSLLFFFVFFFNIVNILHVVTGRAASARSPPPFSGGLSPAAPRSCGIPRAEARCLPATAAPPAASWSGAPTAAAGGLRGTTATRCGSSDAQDDGDEAKSSAI